MFKYLTEITGPLNLLHAKKFNLPFPWWKSSRTLTPSLPSVEDNTNLNGGEMLNGHTTSLQSSEAEMNLPLNTQEVENVLNNIM